MKRRYFRFAIIYLILNTFFASILFYMKSRLEISKTQEFLQNSKVVAENLYNNYQTSYFFYYDEEFKNNSLKILNDKNLEYAELITVKGEILFDSREFEKQELKASPGRERKIDSKDVLLRLSTNTAVSFKEGKMLSVLAPVLKVSKADGEYLVHFVYSFKALDKTLVNIAIAFALVLLFIFGIIFFYFEKVYAYYLLFTRKILHIQGLRTKFIFALLIMDIVSGAIIYFTLLSVQEKEQTAKLLDDSVLFSQFTTRNLINDFSNYFYFYYDDKFVPSVKSIMGADENLQRIKIINRKNQVLLFDTDVISGAQSTEEKKSEQLIPEEAVPVLKEKDSFKRVFDSALGERTIEIIDVYRNENREALYYVYYKYVLTSLKKNIAVMKKQILLDLIPSFILSILIAFVFTGLILRPVRKLVGAVQRITDGDFDIKIEQTSKDELGTLVASFNDMALELRRKKELKRFMSEHGYRKIMESNDHTSLGKGSRINATVLFTDIRDFVATCEKLDAEEITKMLNDYFSMMVQVVRNHGGEVDKFIGDAMMAVFYDDQDSKSQNNTALNAIYCAMDMQESLKEFNYRRERIGKNTIRIGIGISYGELISGALGSSDRMDFTVIGDVVNVASRLEKLSKHGKFTKIIFSNFIADKIQGLVEFEKLPVEQIKGKTDDVGVFELVKIKDVNLLINGLTNDDLQNKKKNIELLGYSQNKNALPAVCKMLSDNDEFVRIQAAISIGKLAEKEDEVALNALFERLKKESSNKVVTAIITNIGKITKGERLIELAPYLNSEDDRMVANTIESIANLEDPKVVDLIVPKLESVHNRVKANAAVALLQHGKIEVVDVLKPMLLHSNYLMRASAAFALGELTRIVDFEKIKLPFKEQSNKAKYLLASLQESVPMLITLLRDDNEIVKRQAIIALGKIKDKSAVLPLIECFDFDRDSQYMGDIAEALRSIGSHQLVREVFRRFS